MAINRKCVLISIFSIISCSEKPEISTCFFENNIYQIETQGYSLSIPIASDLNGVHHYFLRSSGSKMSSDLSKIGYVENDKAVMLSVPGIPLKFFLRDAQCKIGIKNLLNK